MQHPFKYSFGVAALLCGALLSGAAGAAAEAPGTRGAAALDRLMSVADRRHLLLRSGIGAAPEELVALAGLTRREGVERIIAGLSTEPDLPMPAWTRAPPPHYHARPDMSPLERQRFDRARDAEIGELRRWWVREMLAGDSPQTERLVLFWHDLFATSYHGTDRRSLAMARQNRTFRRLGTGSWEELLRAMLHDAALLDFLDNESNRAASPNENLAREFLELFTLGEGAYTQRDVAEAARTLTGYASSDTVDLAFRLRTWDHDDGEKTLFGERGRFDGDDLVSRVLARPAAARHLATRFWQAFVADGAPAQDWLESASVRFRESGHDILTLYRHTLSSDDFWADENRAAIVRSPLDLLLGTARSLDYPKRHWARLPGELATLGMELFAPPDVGGWREGEAWVGGGLLLDRRRLLERLVAPRADAVGRPKVQTAGRVEPGMSVGMAPAAAGRGDPESGMRESERAGTGELTLRLAAEHYRGAAEWRVSLRRGDSTLWRDRPRVLAEGHDTERYGRLDAAAADMPWRGVSVAAPREALARADAVVVEFLNDVADGDGDRNLFIDGVELEGRWLDALDGRQRSGCVPENPLDAGHLYCNGTLTLTLPGRASGAVYAEGELPAWRASAAHVRWAAGAAEDERQTAHIALDDAVTPLGSFHRLQFSLVAETGRRPELRVDSFDCAPDCLERWPECAWRDTGFPEARTIAFPLDARPASARDPCHVTGISRRERALLAALARSAPLLLSELMRSPSGERYAATLAALRTRIGTDADGADGGPGAPTPGGEAGPLGETFVVDAAHAPPPPPSEALPPPPVVAPTLEVLHQALAAQGLGLADVLLAGLPDETLAPLAARPGEAASASLSRIVRHPVYHLR